MNRVIARKDLTKSRINAFLSAGSLSLGDQEHS